MVDIVVIDIAFEAFARLRENVAVAGRVDDGRRFDGHAALLRFEDRADHLAVLDQRGGDPAVQQQLDIRAQHQFQGFQLEPFRVDHRRVGDGAVEGGVAARPLLRHFLVA